MEIEKSALCLLVAREVRVPWSTEQGLLLFSIIFKHFYPLLSLYEIARKLACAIKDEGTQLGCLQQLCHWDIALYLKEKDRE